MFFMCLRFQDEPKTSRKRGTANVWMIYSEYFSIVTARQMCGVKCVFTFFISSGHDTVTICERKSLWCYYMCTFCLFDCISSSIFPVFYTLVSLSLSVQTHSSFNSFSPEENLMAQILLLMLVFIELYRRYFFSNLLRINKSLWNSIIKFPLKNLVL